MPPHRAGHGARAGHRHGKGRQRNAMETDHVQPVATTTSTDADPRGGQACPEPTPGFAATLTAAIARLVGRFEVARPHDDDDAGESSGQGNDLLASESEERVVATLAGHLREMRELLRDELLRRSHAGGCLPVQQRRIAAGAAALEELLRELFEAGEDADCNEIASRSVEIVRDALDMCPETPAERAAHGLDDDDFEDGGLVIGELDDDLLGLPSEPSGGNDLLALPAPAPRGLPAPEVRPARLRATAPVTAAATARVGANSPAPVSTFQPADLPAADIAAVVVRLPNEPSAFVPLATPAAQGSTRSRRAKQSGQRIDRNSPAAAPGSTRIGRRPAGAPVATLPATASRPAIAAAPATWTAPADPAVRIIGARPALLALPAPSRMPSVIDLGAARAERAAVRRDLTDLLDHATSLRAVGEDPALRAFLDS